MKYHNIETFYRGIYFRSRLEARWAAFFDLCGWTWDYEPFDLNGWIPDFLIRGNSSLLVEVKPHTNWEEYILDAVEIEKHFNEGLSKFDPWSPTDNREPLFLGAFPDGSDKLTLAGGVPSARLGWLYGGDEALVVAPASGVWGFCANYGSYIDRISGKYHKEFSYIPFDAVRLRFGEANRQTRYRGVRQ